MFGRLVRCALVTELTISKPSQELRLDEGDITDDRRCAENIPHCAQSPGRVAFLRPITVQAPRSSTDPIRRPVNGPHGCNVRPAQRQRDRSTTEPIFHGLA
jgi:hypothetical protein